MKDTKTVFRLFTVPEWEEEQTFPEQQHKAGWRFESIRFLSIYRFRRCEPEEYTYQLDYSGESGPKEEYIQMFRDCGWEYLQDCGGYSYFRRPGSAAGGEEIFSDEASRMDMVRRVFRGRIVPLPVILLGCLVPSGLIAALQGMPLLLGADGLILLLYLFIFAKFARKYRSLCRR